MTTFTVNRFLLLIVALFTLAATPAHAQLVSWDLQPEGGNTQSGFTPATSLAGTTTGDYSISASEAGSGSNFLLFDRGWSNVDDSGIPYADLYRDKITYANTTTGFDVTISGAGIDANTTYQLRLFSYDWYAPSGFAAGDEVTMNYTGISGTVGTGSVTYTLGSTGTTTNTIVGLPQSELEYSSLVDFTSNSTGEIVFNVYSGSVSASDGITIYNRAYLNGVEVIPEPTSFGLLVASLVGMIAVFSRRHR